MNDRDFSAADYPIAERRPETVRGARGRTLDDLNVEAVAHGELEMEDLRITPQALLRQASIARSAGRAALADNFERAAEMTALPQEEVMRVYELLRPGRSRGKQDLLEAAETLRSQYRASRLADFVEQAAAVYEKRDLFRKRY